MPNDGSRANDASRADGASHHVPSARLELRTWRWALAFFVVAAATGAWLRFGLTFGWPPLLRFSDVRHAHSHLMYFGWVTPVLFAGIAVALARSGGPMRGIGWLLAGTFAAAAASYPAFLTSGYRLTPFFGRDLPLSMVAAGLSGVAWIVFVAMYARARSRMRAGTAAGHAAALAWLDAAVFLLAASLLGIAGLAASGSAGPPDPHLTGGLVDFFLALFGEGWFGAAVLGLAHAAAATRPTPDGGAGAVRSVIPALAFLFGTLTWTTAELSLAVAGRPFAPGWLTGVADAGLPTILAAFGHSAVGAAILLACTRLLRNPRVRTVAAGLWLPAIGLLAAKGLVELAFVVPAVGATVRTGSRRVLLLHAFLLGAVSIALVAAQAQRSVVSTPAARFWSWAFFGSVLALLAGLVPLAGLTPWLPPGPWTLQLAAVTSLGPVVAAVGLWAVAAGEPT
jgi:hypothetical protein